uniref:C2H2-type domain-containing protein n=1 Tax=Timema genevievae TaxID=629358 RepID=A0A7R9K382_TIMGE|nr:unnamed protein product [Timema genevievae]
MRLKEGRRIQKDVDGNKKLFWKWVKRMKQGVHARTYGIQNERGEMIRDENSLRVILRKSFEQLNGENLEKVAENMENAMMSEIINEAGVLKAIKELKNGKAYGGYMESQVKCLNVGAQYYFTTCQIIDSEDDMSKHSPLCDCALCKEKKRRVTVTATSPQTELPVTEQSTEGKEKCQYCGVFFAAHIIFHHRKLHFRERFFSCIDCGKNFQTETGLESHKCQVDEIPAPS